MNRSALFPLLVLAACSKKVPPSPSSNDQAPSSTSSTHIAVPPVAPISDFLDAATSPDGKTPYEQALAYESNGQYWVARLVIEKKALGAEGTKDEAELLARICQVQGDEACVDACGKKLGRKLGMDAGLPRVAASSSAEVTKEGSDLAKAQRLLLQKEYKEARKILEPKVLDGKASTEEIRMLKAVCKEEGDRMCMALCDAKIK